MIAGSLHPLSASELLNAWERGLGQPAPKRSLSLLGAACPHAEMEELARLKVGERDSMLLSLREWAFGTQLGVVAECSRCGERLEWSSAISDLRVRGEQQSDDDLAIESDGYRVKFRLPDSLDLDGLSDFTDVKEATRELLHRCIVSAELNGDVISGSELPETVCSLVAKKMSEADPQGDMSFKLSCPACGNGWEALFDIESFFWTEINVWAQRLLRDIHTLATAYGWREADILGLSPWRRQYYLSLVMG